MFLDHLSRMHHWRVVLVLLILLGSFSITAFCNVFSPLMSPIGYYDSMTFYMAGKSWAHGLLPYVGFEDVKGPLLFLWFYIGYVLSPDRTMGCYVLASLSFALVLGLSYKTARVLGLNRDQAFVAVLLLFVASCFSPIRSFGCRAEEVMFPLLSLLVYEVCRYFYSSAQAYLRACAVCGAVFTALILIKYNDAPVAVAAFVALSVVEWMRSKRLSRPAVGLLVFAVASVLVFLPFAIYMLCTGTFDDFIRVYFFFNVDTYRTDGSLFHTLWGNVWEAVCRTLQGREALLFWLPAAAVFSTPFLRPGQRFGTWTLLLIICVSYAVNVIGNYSYYICFMLPLLALPSCALASRLQIRLNVLSAVILAGLSCLVGIQLNGTWSTKSPRRLTYKLPSDVQAAEDRICSLGENPKILYIDFLEMGFGLRGGALPACPGWVHHNGCSEAYSAAQRECVRQRKADVVVTTGRIQAGSLAHEDGTRECTQEASKNAALLKECGYRAELCVRNGEGYVTLWFKD
ncbi:MAG: glycosyltransferase family 39 protein [Akkermansia muciniphila]|nr:glycosyltransferase family 39 protein [Akkermansia muciniphila]